MSLQKRILINGNATDFPRTNDDVIIQYTGWLFDPNMARDHYRGKKFDSSAAKGQPLSYRVGLGMVIKGWEVAVLQMSLGEKSMFTIPSEMAYGKIGYPGMIPADTALIYEIELRAINDKRA